MKKCGQKEGYKESYTNGNEKHLVKDGDAVIVPAGTYHNVINVSKSTQLKLYTIYSPPNHPDKTVHKTKAEAEKAEAEEHHQLFRTLSPLEWADSTPRSLKQILNWRWIQPNHGNLIEKTLPGPS